ETVPHFYRPTDPVPEVQAILAVQMNTRLRVFHHCLIPAGFPFKRRPINDTPAISDRSGTPESAPYLPQSVTFTAKS
ncbi:MAG: hypothetical protein ACKVG0_15840, partial [Alphaproteobacteria bacterium]